MCLLKVNMVVNLKVNMVPDMCGRYGLNLKVNMVVNLKVNMVPDMCGRYGLKAQRTVLRPGGGQASPQPVVHKPSVPSENSSAAHSIGSTQSTPCSSSSTA
ncbi:unnamed protein product [Boreogadus saida]